MASVTYKNTSIRRYRKEKGKKLLPAKHAEVFHTEKGTPYLKESGVVMISRPQVDIREVYEFLVDFDHELGFWEYLEDPVKDMGRGEQLCKVAGQLCYMSFGPKRTKNKDSRRYFENIIKSQHGSLLEHANFSFLLYGVSRSLCYHPDVEILTSEGWKKVSNLSDQELLLTKNPDTGKCKWSKNKGTKSFDFEGNLLYWKHSQITSPPVTPDHLVWAAKYDTRENKGLSCKEILDKSVQKIPASELYGKRFVVDHSIDRFQCNDLKEIEIGKYIYDSGDFLEWLGLLSTDGTIRDSDRKYCSIAQKKIKNFSRIRYLMNSLFKDRWNEQNGGASELHQFRVHDKDLVEFCIGVIGYRGANRKFSDWVMSLSNDLLQRFWEGALRGDGNVHKNNGHEVLYTCSLDAANQWQQILSYLGKASIIRIDDRRGTSRIYKDKEIKNINLSYIISVSRKSVTMVKKHHHKEMQYKGKVYCPETEDGLVFVRYDKLPLWSGNTHELVRHRAGMAYSQVSQRYVDGSKLRFVERPEFQESTLLHNEFEVRVDDCAEEYKKIAWTLNGHNTKKPLTTDEKKKVNQVARAVLPNETEAPIIVTGNIRAWRHILEMRGSPHAEKEVRNLSLKLYDCLVDQEPILFMDFQKEIIDNEECIVRKEL